MFRHTFFLSSLFALTLCAEQDVGALEDSLASSIETDDHPVQRLQEYIPQEPENKAPRISPLSSSVLIEDLKGCVLIGPKEKVLDVDFEDFRGVGFSKIDIPGNQKNLKKKLEVFLDKPLTRNDLSEIKKIIQSEYKRLGRPILACHVPPQDVTGGVLRIVVQEATLGRMIMRGNKYTDTVTLFEYLHEKDGEPINEDRLIRDVNLVNRNPFRRMNVVYTPGELEGTTNINLLVEDRRPFRAYIGTDNTGVESTDRERFMAGFNYGNMFASDQVLSYQYTCAPDLNRFQAHTAQFSTPTPWGHWLTVYGGWSQVRTSTKSEDLKSYGTSAQLSGRNAIPLKQINLFIHELILGFDFKRTNNTVLFTDDEAVFGNTVNLTQVMAGYECEWAMYENFFTAIALNFFWSPGGWIDHQARTDFHSLRPKSDPKYVYFNGTFSEIYSVPKNAKFFNKWLESLTFIFRGQWSNRNLLPSEMLGLGGFNSVRGYEEREVNVDRGFNGTVEFKSKEWKLVKKFRKNTRIDDGLSVVAFCDFGFGKFKRICEGERHCHYLIGVGPGIRYRMGKWLTARADIGFKMHRRMEYHGGLAVAHFGLVASY